MRPIPLRNIPFSKRNAVMNMLAKQNGKRLHRGQKQTLTPNLADKIISDVKEREDSIVFTLMIHPSSISTAQQKGVFVRNGRAHFFTKSKIANAEKTLQLAFTPYAKLTRKWGKIPVQANFLYFFPYPSGTPKKRQMIVGPMNERPDAANITKGIADAMTRAGMWEDDSYVNSECSHKFRTTAEPRIIIELKKFDTIEFLSECANKGIVPKELSPPPQQRLDLGEV